LRVAGIRGEYNVRDCRLGRITGRRVSGHAAQAQLTVSTQPD